MSRKMLFIYFQRYLIYTDSDVFLDKALSGQASEIKTGIIGMVGEVYLGLKLRSQSGLE